MSSLFVTTGNKHIPHKEGDVWEESGKTWTIKNGLKRTVSKMDHARKEQYIPLACPRCNGSMKGPANEKIWSINKTCINCLIDQEHEIIKAGKWEEYEKAKVLANANAFCADMENALQDYLQQSVSKSNVTEDGMIETWKDVNPKHLKQVADNEVSQLKNVIQDYELGIKPT